MQVTRDRTERPHGALLQLDIECLCDMYRIGRSLGSVYASMHGGDGGILPL